MGRRKGEKERKKGGLEINIRGKGNIRWVEYEGCWVFLGRFFVNFV